MESRRHEVMREAAFSKGTEMQPISQDFAQEIASKYTKLRLFTLNFSPSISTKGTIPLLGRWVELVYAMPYLILHREILTSLKESRTNIPNQSIEQTWNILVSLERNFLSNRYWQQLLSYLESQPPAKAERNIYPSLEKSAIFKPQDMILLTQKTIPVLERAPSTLQKSDVPPYSYKLLKRESQQRGQRLHPYSSSSPRKLIQSVRGQPQGESKAKEKQLPAIDQRLMVTSYQPLALGHNLSAMRQPPEQTYLLPAIKDLVTSFFVSSQKIGTDGGRKVIYSKLPRSYLENRLISPPLPVIARSINDEAIPKTGLPRFARNDANGRLFSSSVGGQVPMRVYFDFISNKQMQTTSSATRPYFPRVGALPLKNEALQSSQLNELQPGEVESIYRTYPRIEPIVSKETPQAIKEVKVIEREVAQKPPQATPQPPRIDTNHLADQVYQLIERKIRIERERRGLR